MKPIQCLFCLVLSSSALTSQTPAIFWAERYQANRPVASSAPENFIATDGSGNVYVAGPSYNTSYDFTVIKYDPKGLKLWEQKYNGAAGSFDIPAGMKTDNSGNVYITGRSYNSAGNYDYVTIKYDSNGSFLWIKSYNGPGANDDYATDLTVDSKGNVYVTGYSPGTGTGSDYATIKYNSSGTEVWVKRHNTSASYKDDYANSVKVDNQGNVYVTGHARKTNYYDFVTVKYDSNGTLLWESLYDGPAANYDYYAVCDIDRYGNVYVAGRSKNVSSDYDYATIRYDAYGNQKWVKLYSSTGSFWDEVTDIATDSSGNVIVTGSITQGSYYNDYGTLKYDSSGNLLWSQAYNGPGNRVDKAAKLVLDKEGNAYVTGFSDNGGNQYDFLTVKYNASSGVKEWDLRVTNKDNAGQDYGDYATDVVVDKWNNTYVVGAIVPPWGTQTDYNYDIYTVKYCSPPQSVSAGSDTAICSGSTVPLNAEGGNSFSWTPGTGLSCSNCKNPVASPAITTVYTVYVSNESQCHTSADSVAVYVNMIPATPVITQQNDTLVSSSAYGNQWLDSAWNSINGAVASTFVPISPGMYYLIVTDSNSCISDTSAGFFYAPTAIHMSGEKQDVANVFPNPSNGEFNLIFLGKEHAHELSLFTIHGSLLMRKVENTAIDVLDLKNFPAGMYCLHLKGGSRFQKTLLIKQ